MKRLFLLAVLLTGCSVFDSIRNFYKGDKSESLAEEILPTPTPTLPSLAPTPFVTDLLINPKCSGTLNAPGNFLWKPESEGGGDLAGNIVIVFDKKYKREFSCKVELANGKYDDLRYTGKANGDRQHHRGNYKAQKYKNKAKIICSDKTQNCTFQISGSPTKRWE